MALARVQEAHNHTAAATSLTVTLGATPSNGNLLIALIRENSGTSTITLPSNGGTWQWVTGHPFLQATARRFGIAYCANISGATTSVTFSSDVSAIKTMYVWEVSGAATSSVEDKTNSNVGASNTTHTTGTTGTLAQAAEFVVAGMGWAAAVTSPSVDSGFTIEGATSSDVLRGAYLITSATTALNPTFTWTTSRIPSGCIASFKEAAASGGATVNAVTATATAAGVAPAVTGGATVTGVAATATATAIPPVVTAGAEASAVTATATTLGIPPTVTGGSLVSAVVATATATAHAPTVSSGDSPNGTVNAVPATATAAAVAPTVVGGAETASVAATSTAVALPPTVTGGGAVIAVSATATATAVAPVAIGGAVVASVVATATAQAHAPTVGAAGDVEVLPPPATATAQAHAPVTGISVPAVRAQATAQAVAPVVGGGATVLVYKTNAMATVYAPVVTGVRNAMVSVPCIQMQGYCPRPRVDVTYPTFRFEPPTHEAPMWTTERPHNYHRLTHAASVVRINGVLTSIHQPRPDQIAAAGEEGVDWFIGGRVYDVTAAVKAELLSAGFPVA